MANFVNVLAKELTQKFGDKTFLTIDQLQEINFFGSPAAARKAVRLGLLPSIKVSERRYVVPREEFLRFVAKNLRGKN